MAISNGKTASSLLYHGPLTVVVVLFIVYVELFPFETACDTAADCDTCVSRDIGFDCKWCGITETCYDALDRYTQDFKESGCASQVNIIKNMLLYMSHDTTKRVFGSFRPGQTQTGLRSHRI